MITAASHVASGLMLAPVASSQPKLTNAGPGQIPCIPQPTPNNAEPVIKRTSTFPFFARAPSQGCKGQT